MSVHRLATRHGPLVVERTGDGPPVVLLHGFTGSRHALAPLTARLIGTTRLAVDLPGHGDTPPWTRLADDALVATAEAIAEAQGSLGYDRAAWVGYSMGGRITLAAAICVPERVSAAAVIGASAGVADPAERARRRAADERLADRIESGRLEAFVDAWMAGPLFRDQRRLGEAHWQSARRQRLANDPEGLAWSLRRLGVGAQPDLNPALAGVSARVLAVAGEHDGKFSPIARHLARALPAGEAAIIAGAGHAAHLEQPDATARRIGAFLGAVGRMPRSGPLEARSETR